MNNTTKDKYKFTTQEITTDYINEYFGGQYHNIIKHRDSDPLVFLGGDIKISKVKIDKDFIEVYICYLAELEGISVVEYFKKICEEFNLSPKRLKKNKSVDETREIIYRVLGKFLDIYDGSLDFKIYNKEPVMSNSNVELLYSTAMKLILEREGEDKQVFTQEDYDNNIGIISMLSKAKSDIYNKLNNG